MKDAIYLFMAVTSVIGLIALLASIWQARKHQRGHKNHCPN